MNYTQLTQEQSYQIYALMKAGFNRPQIASQISPHQSTVSRQVRRNRGQRGFRPGHAHELARTRRRHRVAPRLAPHTWRQVETLLSRQWSPEQISGRLPLERQPTVSHQRSYQHIYADKQGSGTLHRHRRCQKKRRTRSGSDDRQGQLPARTGMERRPPIVDRKQRLGDGEADTNHRWQPSTSHCLFSRAQVEVDPPG